MLIAAEESQSDGLNFLISFSCQSLIVWILDVSNSLLLPELTLLRFPQIVNVGFWQSLLKLDELINMHTNLWLVNFFDHFYLESLIEPE